MPQEKQKLRIAFVGAGKQAQSAHLRHYTTLDDCEVIAIVDKDLDLCARVAARFGVPGSYGSHEELLKEEAPDALVVTLPPKPSGEQTICEILEAGVPLIVEKPLGGSPKGSERIAERAQRSGTLMRVAFHKRSDPATVAAKRVIDRLKETGELGRMTYVRVHACLAGDWIANGYRGTVPGTAKFPNDPHPDDDFPGMDAAARKRFPRFVGGYGHQFDWMRCLVGEPFAIRYAEPTGVLLAVETESGVPAAFECTPYSSTRDWIEYAEVCFEHGYIRIDLPPPLAIHRAGTVTFFRDEGPEGKSERTSPVLPYECAMYQQAVHFLAELRGESTPLCDPSQAHESVSIAAEWAIRLSDKR